MAVDVGQRNVLVGHRPSSLPTCINDVTDWRKGHWRVLAPIWFDFFFSFLFLWNDRLLQRRHLCPTCAVIDAAASRCSYVDSAQLEKVKSPAAVCLNESCDDAKILSLKNFGTNGRQTGNLVILEEEKGNEECFYFFFSSLAFPSLFRDCCVRFKGKSRWHLARSPTANRAWYGNEEMNSKVSHNLLIVVNKWNLNFLERWRVYDTRLIRNRATNVTQCEGEK